HPLPAVASALVDHRRGPEGIRLRAPVLVRDLAGRRGHLTLERPAGRRDAPRGRRGGGGPPRTSKPPAAPPGPIRRPPHTGAGGRSPAGASVPLVRLLRVRGGALVDASSRRVFRGAGPCGILGPGLRDALGPPPGLDPGGGAGADRSLAGDAAPAR